MVEGSGSEVEVVTAGLAREGVQYGTSGRRGWQHTIHNCQRSLNNTVMCVRCPSISSTKAVHLTSFVARRVEGKGGKWSLHLLVVGLGGSIDNETVDGCPILKKATNRLDARKFLGQGGVNVNRVAGDEVGRKLHGSLD